MSPAEFKPLMARIEAWWPGTKWDEPMIAVWFEDFQRFPAADVRIALERLKREHTNAFAPAIGAVLALLEKPEDAPTFEEAYQLIYGPRGALRERCKSVRVKGATLSETENQAALRKANELHPLIAAFMRVQGVGELRMLPVDDPQFGPVRRKELKESYERFLQSSERREVASIATGEGREGLRRLEPASQVVDLAEGRRRLPR